MSTALIIGASRGIGQELAKHYLADGWRVIATARKAEDLASLLAAGCEVLPLDITQAADCAQFGLKLKDEKINVAILNAGLYGPQTDALIAPDSNAFDDVMHVNVLGAMRLLPAVLPLVDQAGGKLAVISSIMASIGERSNSSGWLYRASKAALNSVLKDVSLSAREAVCVALHPGWVKTAMGGAGAALEVADSASAIRRTIAGLEASDNGAFINTEDGSRLGW
jgi:NAD(P)-dependent dehydrogenase (short-subunit alcohol dehydrogenase family)